MKNALTAIASLSAALIVSLSIISATVIVPVSTAAPVTQIVA